MPPLAAPRHQAFAMDWQYPPQQREDYQFMGLLNAYRCSGGLARADEVQALCARRGGPSLPVLARWMVQRDVIGFEWQTDYWLPLFQFQHDMTPLPQLAPVCAELHAVYDARELAAWFVQPNAWLGNAVPADCLLTDPAAVLDAARAARFTSQG
ncbi:hypothetical protein [Rhodoferax sp.]|uniref:hypothetical protein n=1 Tax=Rhodoferax sp. TaxID=50421 RepID=UPI00374D2931